MEYNLISENPQSTVVARYERDTAAAETYQSESELERAFIRQLVRQGYEYIEIHSAAELEANLRRQIERLNNVSFTDAEWLRFFRQEIAAEGKGVVEKARTIQVGSPQELHLRQRHRGQYPAYRQGRHPPQYHPGDKPI